MSNKLRQSIQAIIINETEAPPKTVKFEEKPKIKKETLKLLFKKLSESPDPISKIVDLQIHVGSELVNVKINLGYNSGNHTLGLYDSFGEVFLEESTDVDTLFTYVEEDMNSLVKCKECGKIISLECDPEMYINEHKKCFDCIALETFKEC